MLSEQQSTIRRQRQPSTERCSIIHRRIESLSADHPHTYHQTRFCTTYLNNCRISRGRSSIIHSLYSTSRSSHLGISTPQRLVGLLSLHDALALTALEDRAKISSTACPRNSIFQPAFRAEDRGSAPLELFFSALCGPIRPFFTKSG